MSEICNFLPPPNFFEPTTPLWGLAYLCGWLCVGHVILYRWRLLGRIRDEITHDIHDEDPRHNSPQHAPANKLIPAQNSLVKDADFPADKMLLRTKFIPSTNEYLTTVK